MPRPFPRWLQAPLQRSESAGSIEVLRASLLAAQPKRALSSAALDLLAQPELQRLAPQPPDRRRVRRVLAWLSAHGGVQPRHLALGLQMVVAYTLVLSCIAVPTIDATFRNSLNWTLFVIVSVLEPSTGAPRPLGVALQARL